MYCWRSVRVVPFSAGFTALMEMLCWLPPLPTVTLRVPVLLSVSVALATAVRSAVEVVALLPVPVPAVTVAARVLEALVSTIELAVTVILPLAPETSETRLRRDPLASVSTLAVTLRPEALMAEASPESVLLPVVAAGTSMTVPLMVTEPVSVSALLAISAM